ncbi:DUF6065 family protein [Tepidamorphus sp. 3E244]|uniref:DUF6065 family protein n=1 Tax=Tepidamorphus sp. 3E244 TaxID=3385498 RepID=UPI0038FC41CB
MKLVAYVEEGHELDIRPARPKRAWLDKYADGHAYGCLPMVIANQCGWEICAPTSFTVIWNGGDNRRCLAVLPDEPGHERLLSHFGAGIFSYSFPAIFRVEEGYDLVIQGPPNNPVHGATPLSGIVEADWALTAAAIHWQITEPNTAIRFRKGDALAQIFPIKRGDVEKFDPEMRSISDDPEVAAYMAQWYATRRKFNEGLRDPSSPESQKKWPGHYRRGDDIYAQSAAPADHRKKLRIKPFADLRNSEDSE